jgi:NADH-quinone oxidoreductase subunit E
MENYFSKDLKKKISSYLKRFETKRSSIIPILHAIQDEKDWISDDDIALLEKDFQISSVDVREVLTFYTMYRQSPPKPYRFQICKSISCWLMGANETISFVEKEIENSKKSGKEQLFECEAVECLGQCGYAPASLINKERHLCVDPKKAELLLEEYAKKDLPDAYVRCKELLKVRKG